MSCQDLQIGLSLSGGGFRASVFHLGVLARLAEDDLLEQVQYVSSVSGGSLLTGLLFARNSLIWPSSQVFRQGLPALRDCYTLTPFYPRLLLELLKFWNLPKGRAKLVSNVMQNLWGMRGWLADLPETPRWYINATTYETGRDWRFSRRRMGDYITNFVVDPSFRIADAVAASAAFPGLVGPLVLNLKGCSWTRYEHDDDPDPHPVPGRYGKVHLWDGGVYDNLAVEALFKPGREPSPYKEHCNFLIVSDASAWLEDEKPESIFKRSLRLVKVSMEQQRALRFRMLIDQFRDHRGCGAFVRMGMSVSYLLENNGYDQPDKEAAIAAACTEADIRQVRAYGTDFYRMPLPKFHLLLKHGWETADAALISLAPADFQHRPYQIPAALV